MRLWRSPPLSSRRGLHSDSIELDNWMDRRSFFQSTAGIFAAFQADSTARALSAAAAIAGRPADVVARDEDFWFNVRHAFAVDRNIINLNNGGVSPAPT